MRISKVVASTNSVEWQEPCEGYSTRVIEGVEIQYRLNVSCVGPNIHQISATAWTVDDEHRQIGGMLFNGSLVAARSAADKFLADKLVSEDGGVTPSPAPIGALVLPVQSYLLPVG